MVCPGVLIVATQEIADIDPSYYEFKGCSCRHGFQSNLTHDAVGVVISMQCIAQQVSISHCIQVQQECIITCSYIVLNVMVYPLSDVCAHANPSNVNYHTNTVNVLLTLSVYSIILSLIIYYTRSNTYYRCPTCLLA